MIYLMFNYSYLFTIMFLVAIVIYYMFFVLNFVIYLKFLVIIVYIRGVVVFILYIRCLCWNVNFSLSSFFLLGFLFVIFNYSSGLMSKFSDVGEYLWIFLFFAYLFNLLVSSYSYYLFKVSGSLRF